MRQFLYAFCVAIAIFAAQPAFAANDHRAFPPDNCTTGSPFMGFTGVDGSNTFCNSGQDILNNAIPTCGDGMQVAHEGGKFICKAQTNVPTCQPGTFLSFDGTNYTCNGTGVATCGANQVLTFNGTSYFCVNKDATIPICTANQFLTYNGSYQCAAVQTPAALNVTCPAGQVLSGFSNGAAVCIDVPGNASCEMDHYDSPVSERLTGMPWNYLMSCNKDGFSADLTGTIFPNGSTRLVSTEMVPNGATVMGADDYNHYYPVDTDGRSLHLVNGCAANALCWTCINGNWSEGIAYTPQDGLGSY